MRLTNPWLKEMKNGGNFSRSHLPNHLEMIDFFWFYKWKKLFLNWIKAAFQLIENWLKIDSKLTENWLRNWAFLSQNNDKTLWFIKPFSFHSILIQSWIKVLIFFRLHKSRNSRKLSDKFSMMSNILRWLIVGNWRFSIQPNIKVKATFLDGMS